MQSLTCNEKWSLVVLALLMLATLSEQYFPIAMLNISCSNLTVFRVFLCLWTGVTVVIVGRGHDQAGLLLFFLATDSEAHAVLA